MQFVRVRYFFCSSYDVGAVELLHMERKMFVTVTNLQALHYKFSQHHSLSLYCRNTREIPYEM